MKFKLIIILLSLMLLLSANPTAAQQSDSLNNGRLIAIGGVTAGAFIYGYIIQNNIWWKGSKSKFHFNFQQDWKYALGSDKFGHFFFGTALTKIYGNAFQWAGMNRKKALLYSGILSWSYQTFIEIRDGFSKEYGFSWGDFTANSLGALFPNLQQSYPFLRNFNFKLSFYPSERFKNESNRYILDDYESTYNWLSIDVKNILPHNVGKFIPPFVRFAIGHSVKRLLYSDRGHELFLALDWDISFIKTDNYLLKSLLTIIGLYHLPSPAVKIYPNVVWYGLKF